MPKNPAARSAWNFLGTMDNKVCVTYWLNVLQNLGKTGLPYLVTLNPSHTPEHKLLKWSTGHPFPSVVVSKASFELDHIQGKRGIWFCGAYQGYSFHEDGLKRNAVESAKSLMNAAIVDNLDLNQLNRVSASSNSFKIVGLGCSVGPNTFIAVQNIIESVKLVCQCQGLDSEALEFQVLFNDQASNDFNMLFKCLSKGRQYFAAGVPGSFHGRLFPKSSFHLMHSSYSLQWLSKVPPELVDKQSPAWNKGRIYYGGAPKEVFEAYEAQFAKDMESFLNARALELVPGGLMALAVPCHPSDTPPSPFFLMVLIQLLEAILNDMANMVKTL
ncbi:putative S-adenosylmethionine-dependent methyltransferase [Camellia lanceoleosa]|uniref:S-adenosylmethionine-dependent methyltransferase n=1 Tax=Camellia lanceoleosa TaxID=1840588 RepID=A0ACC0I5A1_9ERIC|nr:putative S-adenosylmethionine-dependent methyltransferase [Camellia lanceoleosa]